MAPVAAATAVCYAARMGTGATAVIGLTGGIASGKSSVAARWRDRGARVIDADALAREVVEPGQPALDVIARTFGAEYILPDGRLDRRRLGAHVFADPAALARLNAITHPAILARVGRALADAHRDGLPWVVYEAALIIENQLHPGLSLLVAVLADPAAQLARTIARDGLDESLARQRIAAQTDNATRRAQADLLIANEGGLEHLAPEADRVFDAIVARFGPLPGHAVSADAASAGSR